MQAEIKKTCEVVRITYRNTSSGWGVLQVKTELGTGPATGEIPEGVGPGDIITIAGNWVNDKKWGKQFKFSSIEIEPPKTDNAEGVRRLLMKLPWVGPAKAGRAIKEFGFKRAWELALSDPVAIGVPVGKADAVKAKAAALLSSYDSNVYFLGIGLTCGQINKITKAFGEAGGVKVVKETPYRLLEIDGFGFSTVDSIALRAGVNPGSYGRISACIVNFLKDSKKSKGHVWFYMSTLIEGEAWKGGIAGVLELLRKAVVDNSFPLSGLPGKEEIKEVVLGLKAEGKVVIEEGRIFDTDLLKAEKGILKALGL